MEGFDSWGAKHLMYLCFWLWAFWPLCSIFEEIIKLRVAWLLCVEAFLMLWRKDATTKRCHLLYQRTNGEKDPRLSPLHFYIHFYTKLNSLKVIYNRFKKVIAWSLAWLFVERCKLIVWRIYGWLVNSEYHWISCVKHGSRDELSSFQTQLCF